MRVDLSWQVANGCRNTHELQLHIVERLKEEQPGGAGCGRATWVQTEPMGPILDNF